jgi:DnaJ family protein C protein 17
MPLTTDVRDLDLYGILNVDRQATSKQIVTAYRKQALKCHPDKNPDNPAAVELFHQLSKALELLTDPAARAAYNKVLDGKLAATLRHKELDSKRKKFKEDLEAREKAAEIIPSSGKKKTELSAAEALRQEMDRLREEGSALLKAEQERLRQLLKEDLSQTKQTDSADEDCSRQTYKLRLKWKSNKADPDNGGYSANYLEQLLKKYGEINVLVISSKKKGTAMVEYTTYSAAMLAMQSERGLTDNPLTISWLTHPVVPHSADVSSSSDRQRSQHSADGVTPSINRTTQSSDFESIVLMRLRQAEERKRLTQELEQEDDTHSKNVIEID